MSNAAVKSHGSSEWLVVLAAFWFVSMAAMFWVCCHQLALPQNRDAVLSSAWHPLLGFNMWPMECGYNNNKPVITMDSWYKPFPAMGGLWHCDTHITHACGQRMILTGNSLFRGISVATVSSGHWKFPGIIVVFWALPSYNKKSAVKRLPYVVSCFSRSRPLRL